MTNQTYRVFCSGLRRQFEAAAQMFREMGWRTARSIAVVTRSNGKEVGLDFLDCELVDDQFVFTSRVPLPSS